jgi:hypothetical protein
MNRYVDMLKELGERETWLHREERENWKARRRTSPHQNSDTRQAPWKDRKARRKKARNPEGKQEDQEPEQEREGTYYRPPLLLPPPIQGLGPRRTHSRGPTHTRSASDGEIPLLLTLFYLFH